MHMIEGHDIGLGKCEFMEGVKELYYVVERRTPEQESSSFEYYISMNRRGEKSVLRIRCIQLDGDEGGQDAWIEEHDGVDGCFFEMSDDVTDLILGLYPDTRSRPDHEGLETRGLRISGIPGRYSLDLLDEENPLGGRKAVLTLEKNMFIPDNFHSEMIFDVNTGLMLSMSKVDTKGFLSIELKKMVRE